MGESSEVVLAVPGPWGVTAEIPRGAYGVGEELGFTGMRRDVIVSRTS